MAAVSGNTLKDGRLWEYNGSSTEFKFVFKSYSGVVTRTTDLVVLMSFLSEMRTGTSDRNAAESWLIPIERDWEKGKHKEQKETGNKCNCRKWVTKVSEIGMEKRNKLIELEEEEAVRRLCGWPPHRYIETDIDIDVNTK